MSSARDTYFLCPFCVEELHGCKKGSDKRVCCYVGGERGSGRTDHGEAYWHEDPDKVVDDLEHGPFLGAKEFPGPRGKNEGIPSGDGQRAHEKVLVGGQMGRELERVRKKACVCFAVSLEHKEKVIFWGDALMMSVMIMRGGTAAEGREGLSRWRTSLDPAVI